MNYFALDVLLDTEQDMDPTVRNGSKNDDGTDAITGVDWFLFDGIPAATLYVNGNNWIGLGVSSAQLNVCNRDGATYTILRQEGRLNGWRFLKLRVKGYTYYSSTAVQYALTYELFLLENGSMFLNVAQTPTSTSYLGASSLVCSGADHHRADADQLLSRRRRGEKLGYPVRSPSIAHGLRHTLAAARRRKIVHCGGRRPGWTGRNAAHGGAVPHAWDEAGAAARCSAGPGCRPGAVLDGHTGSFAH